jgi:ATP-binding cassette subfamily A (ABC1) protein 3
MALIFKQIGALVRKDIALVLNRRSLYFTLWRALWIPIIFSIYMSFILRVYWPKETYGIGSPTPIRTLNDAMNTATGGRNTLVFVNSINSGGDIDKVIQLIAEPVQAAGKTVKIFNNYTNLVETCRSTLQGTTKCYGAVVFNSSPKEGPDGVWNYTLKADATFGTNMYVQKTNNDAEIYQLPLQRAVDMAIATVNVSGTASSLPAQVDEYRMYSRTFECHKTNINQHLHR